MTQKERQKVLEVRRLMPYPFYLPRLENTYKHFLSGNNKDVKRQKV